MNPYSTSQIIRAPHVKNFSKLQNEYHTDRRISAPARAIIGNLLIRPDNWVINIKFLCAEMCMGVVAVKKALQELEKYGYIIRERIKDAAGRFRGTRTHIMEMPIFTEEEAPSEPFSSTVQEPTVRKSTIRKIDPLISAESNNYGNEQQLSLSPTPQKFQYQEEEIDFWLDSPLESIQPEVVQTKALDLEVSNVDQQEPELTANLSTAIIPGEERSSAVDYIQTTVSNIKPTRKERQSAQRNATWVEFGKENGL
jgi:hypothetical protein